MSFEAIQTKGVRSFNKFESGIWLDIDIFGRFDGQRTIAANRNFPLSERHSEIAHGGNVKLLGDYYQRRSGRATGGKLSRFECGSTSR